MAKQNAIYKCDICGNVVSVLEAHAGELVCCGQPMNLLEEKTAEQEGKEKHVPVVESFEGGIRVKVGSIPHPMEEKHFIEWIEATDENGKITKVFLNPGEKPEVEFEFEPTSTRAYCNLHGLWKSK